MTTAATETPPEALLSPQARGAVTLAANRRDHRQRLREQAEEREREVREQIERGTLKVRYAKPRELQRLQADRARYLEEHPEAAEQSAKVAYALRHQNDARTTTCPHCGVLFENPTGRRKYCSRSCASVATHVTKKMPACQQCGQPVKRHRCKYCSPECGIAGRARGKAA